MEALVVNRKQAEFKWRHFCRIVYSELNAVFFKKPDKFKVVHSICLYFMTQADVITYGINLGQLLNITPTYTIQTYLHTHIPIYIHTRIDCQNIE